MNNIRSFIVTLTLTTLATISLGAMDCSDLHIQTEEISITVEPPVLYTQMLSCVKLDDAYALINFLNSSITTSDIKTNAYILQICLNTVGKSIDQIYKAYGSTLHWAVYWGYTAVIETLLLAANKNAYDFACIKSLTNDETPLHWAARLGNVEIVRMLLATAPSTAKVKDLITMKNTFGMTALDYATLERNSEIINILNAYITMDVESTELQDFLSNKEYSLEIELNNFFNQNQDVFLLHLEQQL